MELVSASSSDEGGANKGVATFMFMDANAIWFLRVKVIRGHLVYDCF